MGFVHKSHQTRYRALKSILAVNFSSQDLQTKPPLKPQNLFLTAEISHVIIDNQHVAISPKQLFGNALQR